LGATDYQIVMNKVRFFGSVNFTLKNELGEVFGETSLMGVRDINVYVKRIKGRASQLALSVSN
jgi:hypothetical protein